MWLALLSRSWTLSAPYRNTLYSFQYLTPSSWRKTSVLTDCWVIGYTCSASVETVSFPEWLYQFILHQQCVSVPVPQLLCDYHFEKHLTECIKSRKYIYTHLSSNSTNWKDGKRYMYNNMLRNMKQRSETTSCIWPSVAQIRLQPFVFLWLLLCYNGRV